MRREARKEVAVADQAGVAAAGNVGALKPGTIKDSDIAPTAGLDTRPKPGSQVMFHVNQGGAGASRAFPAFVLGHVEGGAHEGRLELAVLAQNYAYHPNIPRGAKETWRTYWWEPMA